MIVTKSSHSADIRPFGIRKAAVLVIAIVTAFMTGCGGPSENKDGFSLSVPVVSNADLEIGGPYAGLAFHDNAMIPQRVSFFYPVANSIDRSADYWTRDTSYMAQWRVTLDGEDPVMIGRDSCGIDLTPQNAVFSRGYGSFRCSAEYSFCLDEPGFVLELSILNTSDETLDLTLDTRYWTGFRTCHTYRSAVPADSRISEDAWVADFIDKDTGPASLLIITGRNSEAVFHSGRSWGEGDGTLWADLSYKKTLEAGESFTVEQIFASCRPGDVMDMIPHLRSTAGKNAAEFNKHILNTVTEDSYFRSGDIPRDRSAAYAKAVMAVNRHYLDGEILPMPCPAEYNFYFTHDVLVSDLGAVYFDLPRVREDLDFIMRHADSSHIIPHAYYWKDGRYVTEFADSDNWNNFWFVQVCAAYLKHSNDREFLERAYPFVRTCVERSMLTLEDDDLMWSYRPDWWDIGHNYGPRTYMTSLAVKTLKDFLYISTVLEKDSSVNPVYKELIPAMTTALNEKLWNEDMGYLVNYHNDGSLDEHYYIGSLLSVQYGLLDGERSRRLMETAAEQLLDPEVGVYNVFPMDFEDWGEYLKFVGNEAGAKYEYMNGGIWSQGNAWYAMALISQDRRSEADAFIRRTMSLYGIMNGPNGQPAYYEVRNPNRSDPENYGRVDKPQFLWAAAWYLNSLYRLTAVDAGGSAVILHPWLPEGTPSLDLSLALKGKNARLHISGAGNTVKDLFINGKRSYSLVIDDGPETVESIEIVLGDPDMPYLEHTGSILKDCSFNSELLSMSLLGYGGFKSSLSVISMEKPSRVAAVGLEGFEWNTEKFGTFWRTTAVYVHGHQKGKVEIFF